MLLIPITFTNRDAAKHLSLDFSLFWWRDEPSRRYKARPHSKDVLDALTSPLAVAPQTTKKGDLLYQAEPGFALEYGGLMRVAVKERFGLTLRITDHVTGTAIERPVYGSALGEGLG